ncbi:MAG: carboxypeptidase regulatory-like domain-containing protein [Planctomycetes bacterium]|nr:carboxypeptidase regulatory-like domain-containing protein [Planctomycetota bacterium]
MRSLLAGLSVVCVWASAVLPASAGWDNVFQPTLFERWHRPASTSLYYVPPAVVVQSSPIVVGSSPIVVAGSSPCDPCEQKKCSTNWVQRSSYQPITTMESRTVTEKVTTMHTSYYYAPVTTYRYSSYYDPTTCCYQQIAVPQCGYELRAKQCPVESWVSRCVQVPVQTVHKVDYWQPVTTCCTTTTGAPVYGTSPPPGAVMPTAPSMTPIPGDKPPVVNIDKTPGTGMSKPPMWYDYYPKSEKITPENRSSSFQPRLEMPLPIVQPAPQPPVKVDRIAVNPDSRVEGQVVRADQSPKPNAKVLFINAMTGKKQVTFANTAGRFYVDLSAGSWHMYLHGADDAPVYASRVDVNGSQTRQVSLVSRTN